MGITSVRAITDLSEENGLRSKVFASGKYTKGETAQAVAGEV